MADHRNVHGLRRDGTEVPIEVALHPIETADGPIILTSVTDVSERRRLEDALRSSQERLTLSLAGSPDGVWDWDIPSGDVFYSSRFKWLLGYQDDEFGDAIETFHEHIHPDDRESALSESDVRPTASLRES